MTQDEGPMTVAIFPFDLFGSGGTGAGAQLLGDALREAVDDAAAEDRPTRTHAFADRLRFEEHPFDTLEQVAAWRETGRRAAREALAGGGFTLWLAGNHLGVLPVYEELGPDAVVIQFDAHLDCYDLHDCTEELSHGNFLLHAEGRLPAVVNVGHRDLFLTPKDVKRTFVKAHPAEAVTSDTGKVAADVRKRRAGGEAGVDRHRRRRVRPGVLPRRTAAGPVRPDADAVLTVVGSGLGPNVAGVSVSEFDPGRDVRDLSLNLLGWLTERVLLKRVE